MNLIHLKAQATPEQLRQMLEALSTYVKLAVDVRRQVAVGGGELHYDCEQMLLEDGSVQEDVWGCDWYPHEQRAIAEANINIRPRQGNRSRLIEDTALRAQVEDLARRFLEGVSV